MEALLSAYNEIVKPKGEKQEMKFHVPALQLSYLPSLYFYCDECTQGCFIPGGRLY